jgi:hypothetical protein
MVKVKRTVRKFVPVGAVEIMLIKRECYDIAMTGL